MVTHIYANPVHSTLCGDAGPAAIAAFVWDGEQLEWADYGHCVSCPECLEIATGRAESSVVGAVRAAQSDPVNKPHHYRWLPVEAIEITELFNFNMGNALKYIIRADHKGKPIEDLEKARWYLDREIQRRSQ